MEIALNKSLHNAAVFMFEHLQHSKCCMTEQTNIDDGIMMLPAPVAKKQKLSTAVASEIKQIELCKGHFYVNKM